MNNGIGRVSWVDLAVPNAEKVRDFYSRVIGWTSKEHDMETYFDYEMKDPETDETVAGVCHAQGINAQLPPAWMVYFTVADLDDSLAGVKEMGGEVIGDVRGYGADRYAFVRDPGGAVCALYQKGAQS